MSYYVALIQHLDYSARHESTLDNHLNYESKSILTGLSMIAKGTNHHYK